MILDAEKLVNIYLYSAILGAIIFIIKVALPHDFGTEVDTDFNAGAESDSSFNLFTVEGISAFFMCGGLMGYVAYSQANLELKMTMLIAIISGIVGMVFFAFLITRFKKLEHVVKPDLNELVGRTGKAYMNFAPKGNSKIQIEFNSKLAIIEAVNAGDEAINSFEAVKVVRVENDTVYIEKE